MKQYTLWLVIAAVALAAVMLFTRTLSWPGLGNNLLVGLICALLTATVFTWVIERDRRRLDGLWASEVIFMPLIDVQLLIQQGARWLLADDPPGVEAGERWMKIADELARRRESLGGILTREILLAVVELENDLRRVDFVTARGEESRKSYAKDLFGLWWRYHHLMDRMLPPRDELRKDLLLFPKELRQLQSKYDLTERGNDRAEDEAIRAALKR
jgi:hypothetical protein